MKRNIAILLLLLSTLCFVLSANAQTVGGGYEQQYNVVTYELIPKNPADTPISTVIMQVPVNQEYYNSILVGQEVTSWFKTNEGFVLLGHIDPKYKIIIRKKEIWKYQTVYTQSK